MAERLTRPPNLGPSASSTGCADTRRPEPSPYSRLIEILFVCTANQRRSPLAAAFLRNELAARGISGVEVISAGLLGGGAPATAETLAAAPDLADHVSQQLTPQLVAAADLVLGMSREHVREAVVLLHRSLPRVFTLKELVRRAEAVGRRAPDEPLELWLARIGGDRRPSDLLGDSVEDDVYDLGERDRVDWWAIVDEVSDLVRRLVDGIWPVGTRHDPGNVASSPDARRPAGA